MKKILTIDGGGIKGVFAASFLANLEQRCEGRIVDYFDLIAGTSTGAIIAAALAVGIPAQDVLNLYMQKADKIFPKHKGISLYKGRYATKPLEEELRAVFGDTLIKDCKTRLVIPAFNLKTTKTRVFKTQHAENLFFDKDLKIVDCLLATTAAPTYFSPYKMEGGTYIDGGVGANNPSMIALVEGISRCGWELSDIRMLSIGGIDETGITNGSEKMGILDALTIQKCFMSAENQYSEYICRILMPKGQYIRINHMVQKNQVALDSVSKEVLECLDTWGYNQAMQHIDLIKKKFLENPKEDVIFYNQ